MTYEETLTYLFSQLPMYQRIGKAAYKADLSNTIALCQILDHPEKRFKSIHLAGTNGKGSTAHMLASVLQESGYNVGLYTSPHLKDFRERIKINGEMISETAVVDFVKCYKAKFEAIDLSFFEWSVGLAFDYFACNEVDIAIIETGLGGRLDSTNVIRPEVSVITNIGLDHTQFLGDTLELIAKEKAGIIKRNVPVVIGEKHSETKDVFTGKATALNAPIYFTDANSECIYETDLKGIYQKKNVRTCLMTIGLMQEFGWVISNESISKGLLSVVKNTGLLGRWQILSESPLVVCDTGHNMEGIVEIMKQIGQTSYNKLHIVFGVVNDKSVDGMLELLPKKAKYYFCQASIARALSHKELKELGDKKGLEGNSYGSVTEALEVAKSCALSDDMIFIGGSTFVVAEVLQKKNIK